MQWLVYVILLFGFNTEAFIDLGQVKRLPVSPKKIVIDQLLAQSCDDIKNNLRDYPALTMGRATQYFTPIFKPGKNGLLRPSDRRACLNIEGSCIVGKYLYNYPKLRYLRSQVKFIFGKGNGAHPTFNTTNALDPCRTIAADQSKFPKGSVIYVPSMDGAICPQSGLPVDGCFIVGDIGSAIKGNGRFDFFTGECADYSKRTNVCNDKLNKSFVPVRKAKYYLIRRHNKRAKALREETDILINNDWSSSLLGR